MRWVIRKYPVGYVLMRDGRVVAIHDCPFALMTGVAMIQQKGVPA